MKNYVIFGATSEIGKGLINSLINDIDVQLLLLSRSKLRGVDFSKSKSTIKELSGFDFCDGASIEHLSEVVINFFDSPFNCVVPSGEFWDHRSFEDVSFEEAMKISNSHYASVYFASKIVLPHMKNLGGGRLVTFSCNSVRYLYPNMAPFCSSKAAVEALTKCLAHEYAKYGVAANCLRLSSLNTPEVVESKPFGDSEHYMSVEDVVSVIRKLTESFNPHLNASVIELYEYSESFYNQGYFQRIKQK